MPYAIIKNGQSLSFPDADGFHANASSVESANVVIYSGVATVTDALYWAALCPVLHVGAHWSLPGWPLKLPAGRIDELRTKLRRDGFFVLSPTEARWPLPLGALVEGARKLAACGWPATMLLMYDETWAMAHQLFAYSASPA